MVVYALEQLGKEYATILLLKFFWRLFFGLKMTRRDPRKPPGKFFCSQYVSAVYNAAGFDLEIQFSDKFTTLRRISESRLLEYAVTVKEHDV